MARKASLAIALLGIVAIVSCGPVGGSERPRGEPAAVKTDVPAGFSRWVRCEKASCPVWLTTDLSAVPPGETPQPWPTSAAEQMRGFRQFLGSPIPPAPLGREMGVVLTKGNKAVVSWADPFYGPAVQIVYLTPESGWRLLLKQQPMGQPPDTAALVTLRCFDPDGCPVYETDDLADPASEHLLGYQGCRAAMGVFVIDGRTKRYVVSYPMVERGQRIQVVYQGQWSEVDSPPPGFCSDDDSLTDQQRCALSGGTWDSSPCPSACPPPRCGETLARGCAVTTCGQPSCRCPETRPYWDDARGCLGGGHSEGIASLDPLYALSLYDPAPTCGQAGGVCAEFAWPVISAQCPDGYVPLAAAGACTPDAENRPRLCCVAAVQ